MILKTRKIFCDMDGVTVDFDRGFYQIFQIDPHSIPRTQMWDMVRSYPNYYFHLPPMPDYLKLWASIEHFNPIKLTAIPRKGNIPTAEQDKRNWVARYIGNHVEVRIGPYAHDKKNHCTPGDVLIDDRIENINDWNSVGGIGILHTSAINTIQLLTDLQII